jgi:hypothetical protein
MAVLFVSDIFVLGQPVGSVAGLHSTRHLSRRYISIDNSKTASDANFLNGAFGSLHFKGIGIHSIK